MKPSDFGILVASLALLPLSLLWRAFVFRDLWAWFVLPTFGLSVPDYGVAIGLMCLAWLVRSKTSPRRETTAGDFGREGFMAAVGPAVYWGIGWVCVWAGGL